MQICFKCDSSDIDIKVESYISQTIELDRNVQYCNRCKYSIVLKETMKGNEKLVWFDLKHNKYFKKWINTK